MRKFQLLLFLGVMMLVFSCAKWQQDYKHFNSQVVGLKRIITLYSSDGQIIKKWEGRFRVEHVPGGVSFISHGKVIIISGTYIIEEE